MEAEGATIRQEHKKVMARHILTETKKMCFHLQELDYEAVFVAIDTEQNLHSSGTTEGQKCLDKEGVMLMVLLKKQPVQHYVPACRSSLTKNTLVFGQWMQLNPRNTKLCGMQVRAEEQ
ncbi:uncharacterized protein [Apostichopus japonicus]|uniref:uncharacterized protein isoform X3 n=1 Tax=Stichopus japonicus TaxID=307972 RepID=UPI003AB15E95